MKIELESRLLRETLAGYAAPPTTESALQELADVCRDLVRQLLDIRDWGTQHHLLAVTVEGYDFHEGERKFDGYLDDYIERAERALKLVEPVAAECPETLALRIDNLRACLKEARLCRHPNQDYADRPEVQASFARSEEDIRCGRIEEF